MIKEPQKEEVYSVSEPFKGVGTININNTLQAINWQKEYIQLANKLVDAIGRTQ